MENKIMAYIYGIYMVMISLLFEMVMIVLNGLVGEVLKVPIEFFLCTFALCMPICHRVMALIQSAHKGNVLFDLGKYILDFYFVILFIATIYHSSFFMVFRWIIYSSFVMIFFYYIQNGMYIDSDNDGRKQCALSFQLMSIEYCILLVILCNFHINCLTISLMILYTLSSILMRVYTLVHLGLLKKYLLQYVFSEILEMLAFSFCFILLPHRNVLELKQMLYDTSVTLYIDILIMVLVFILFEIPMYSIRNKIWKGNIL